MKRLGKQVQFHGIDLWLTMPYAAVDEDGAVFNYDEEPYVRKKPIRGYWTTTSAFSYKLGYVDLEGLDWKETLLRFDV